MLAFILAHVANALMFVVLMGASFLIGSEDAPEAPAAVTFPKTQDSGAVLPRDFSQDSQPHYTTPAAPQIIDTQAEHTFETDAAAEASATQTAALSTADPKLEEDVFYGNSGDDMLWGSSDTVPVSDTSTADILMLGAADQVEDTDPFSPALSDPETIEIAGFDPAEDQLRIEYDAMTDPETGAALPAVLSVIPSKDGQNADIAINDVIVAKLAGVQGITPAHIQLVAR
ncbi:hypothetical protein [Neptunicoccus sediminis]|uniref:hypothetical protein n=1 Tax=Neptunicoccus sediminis TaxID=1892596 RepID=UPI000845E51F|nr:hypothetical protein [Neptunicoccus sediminis]